MQALWRFPWHTTAATLRERFREDQLGVAAGSLTFTTIMSLVPLFAVGLAVFSAFPVFARMQMALQNWLVDSLVPQAIARQVLTYLSQFAAKAGQMGWTGAVVLLISALALVLTIDGKLNGIWRVRRARPLAQRVLVYWALLTLGPLLLGISLSLTSSVLVANERLVGALPGGVKWAVQVLGFGLVTLGMVLLYRYVPNTRVHWGHATVGGLFAATGLAVTKALLGWYVAAVPSYSLVYGAFATVPILLVWMYALWVIVLLGAVVTAYLPSLLAGIERRGDSPGWSFQLALEVLNALAQQRQQASAGHWPGAGTGASVEAGGGALVGAAGAVGATGGCGLTLDALARRLRVSDLQLEEPLEVLLSLGWLGRLDDADQHHVLLADTALTPLTPLVQRLLLPENPSTHLVLEKGNYRFLVLNDVLSIPQV